MNRFSTLIWMLAFVVASFMLYVVKYKVQSLQTQIGETSHELEAQKEALHVAAAEWAYLNRPERLEMLAAKYLSASDMTVDQVADIEAIPFAAQTEAANAPPAGFSPVSAKVRRETGGIR